MVQRAEVLIVGGGPAGMAAAIEASRMGAGVLLIDENPQPGGQIYAQPPPTLASSVRRKDQQRGRNLIAALGKQDVQLLGNTLAWAAFPEKTIAICHQRTSSTVQAGALIVAAGATEYVAPFPGWTLPGVMTAGGAGRLVRTQGLLPGHRIVVSGSGPQLLVTAVELLEAGAEVVAVCESSLTPITGLIRHLPAFFGHAEYLVTGISLMTSLLRARVPYLVGRAVVAAHGSQDVRSVTVKRVDKNGFPIDATEQCMEVDTVCVNHGFLPSYQLLAMLGCKLESAGNQSAWVPWRDQNMQTSIEGVFAVGDCAGIGGVEVALAQGRLAGMKAAEWLGYRMTSKTEQNARHERHRLARMVRLRRALDDVYRPGPGLASMASQNTIICRCEEVKLSAIDKAIAQGAADLNQIKQWTRAGMGPCQGRYCQATIAARYRAKTAKGAKSSVPIEGPQPFTVRPPVKPIPLGALAKAEAEVEPEAERLGRFATGVKS
jgi:thioredoxin reductase/bacterioferritin-associated ferredoxin